MIGIIVAALIVTVAVILVQKNDKEADLPEKQSIMEDEGSDKDNVVDGSELFEDAGEADESDGQNNVKDSNSQGNTNNSGSQGNTGTSTNQNSADTGTSQGDSDNVEEDIFGDETQGEEEDDTNTDNKVDDKEEDKDAAEWTPNY